jgi:lipopolysaccharide export system permease protein
MYFRNIYKQILTTSPLAKFNEKTITKVGDYNIYAHKVNSKDNTLSGVNIYKFFDENNKTDKNAIPWRIASSSATITVNRNIVYLKLFDGYWQMADPKKVDSMIHMNFGSYEFAIPFGDGVDFSDISLKELTSDKLREKISKTDKKDSVIYTYTNEYWFRWILAIAPIVFALIAIPIGIMAGKGGKAIGFGMSLIVIFIYYMFLVISLNIGEKGYVPSCYVMWLPNIVITVIGLILFRKMSKK